jgi:Winged helix DNA-binding domain
VPVGERVLTQRELNRALLARQLLLERARLPLPRVLERLCGIQNQYAPNAYIRLWSCVEGFRRPDLDRALERRSVVQATLLRGTIHLVSARDYAPLRAAIAEARREWSSRIHRGVGDEDRDDLVSRIRGELRGRTCSRAELHVLRGGAGSSAWQTVDTDAALVRVPPSGTWERRRAHTFALAEDWVGLLDVDVEEATSLFVRRYLAGFGPASTMDIGRFTGLQRDRLEPVLERISLRRFRDEVGGELFDVPRAPLPDPETPAPVRFLPTWDATLLVHARRTGILPEEYRRVVFATTAPQSFPTFLVDGVVAGTWKHDGERIRLQPFGRLSLDARRELRAEAERLAAELYAD